jgi:hypothetical protein
VAARIGHEIKEQLVVISAQGQTTELLWLWLAEMVDHARRLRATVDIIPKKNNDPGTLLTTDIREDARLGVMKLLQAAMDVTHGIQGELLVEIPEVNAMPGVPGPFDPSFKHVDQWKEPRHPPWQNLRKHPINTNEY